MLVNLAIILVVAGYIAYVVLSIRRRGHQTGKKRALANLSGLYEVYDKKVAGEKPPATPRKEPAGKTCRKSTRPEILSFRREGLSFGKTNHVNPESR